MSSQRTEQAAAAAEQAAAAAQAEVQRLRAALAAQSSLLQCALSKSMSPLMTFGTRYRPRGRMGQTYLAAPIDATTHPLEHSMLREAWGRGGVGRTAPNRFRLARIEAVQPQPQDGFDPVATFCNVVRQVDNRRAAGTPLFNAAFFDAPPTPPPNSTVPRSTDIHYPTGEKRAVLQYIKQQFAGAPPPLKGLDGANVLLAFHGCSAAAADAICANGFASLHTLDSGYFGKGVYMTTHAEYAAEYASGVHSDPPTVAQPGEEFVVIAAWACPGLIYPITRDHAGIDCDYAPGEAFSKFCDPPVAGQRPQPRALKNQFDSHYACISTSAQHGATHQAVDGVRHFVGGAVGASAPDYDELVISNGSALLPAYRLTFTL